MSASSLTENHAGRRSSSNYPNNNNQSAASAAAAVTNNDRRLFRWFWCWCCRRRRRQQQQRPPFGSTTARLMLNSPYWHGVMILSAMILLFLHQLQQLFLPPISDTAIDVIALLTFCCCTTDIFCHGLVEDNYLPGICSSSLSATPTNDDTATSENNNATNNNGSTNNMNKNSSGNLVASFSDSNNIKANADSSRLSVNSLDGLHQNPQQQHQSSRRSVNFDPNGGRRNSRRGSGSWCGGCSSNVGSFLFWCDVISTLTLLFDVSWINASHFSELHFEIALGAFGIPISGMASVNQARPVELNFLLLVTICQSARLARLIRSSRAVKIAAKVNWIFLLNVLSPGWWWQQFRLRKQQVADKHGGDSDSNKAIDGGDDIVSPPPGEVGVILEDSPFVASSSRTFSSRMMAVAGVSSYARVWQWLGRTPLDSPEHFRQMAVTKIQRWWRAVLLERKEADEYYYFSGEFLSPGVSSSNVLTGSGASSSDAAARKRVQKRQEHQQAMRYNNNRNESQAMLNASAQINMEDICGNKRRNESQVGSAMRELTEQRVAVGIIIALLLTVFFTYTEENATRPTTMIVLHNQTGNVLFADKSLTAARSSAIPDLFYYQLANGQVRNFDVTENGASTLELRPRERLRISIRDSITNRTTVGVFSYRTERRQQALVSLLSTIFILLIWFFGVALFAGPVMVLVVIPIERMVRLLAMLMVDPLGYQSTPRYKQFVDEENEITKNTRWTKEILKGMETSFLMSTILRIGSLMKVGFGSAGVEIIRNNLEKGQNKNMLVLSSQGSTVSCIFLFCDIRNFTDATECLQEEVFVFTNRIAAVVHSNCHSLGGSANKNVGDAFLLSWQLDESTSGNSDSDDWFTSKKGGEAFSAKNSQADKALLSVVRICMALHYDDYYIGTMTDAARQALVAKLKHRKGPIVQMGFGLHAGRAVQGAIGSQRKIDATYVSEAVERAEFLESSTKQYGLKMLMSDSFHRLLHPSNRRRCRKIDQILIREDDDDDEDGQMNGDIMDLFTFDLDINALWIENKKKSEAGKESDSMTGSEGGSRRGAMSKMQRGRRMSVRLGLPMQQDDSYVDEVSQSGFLGTSVSSPQETAAESEDGKVPKLVLPTGPALYNTNVWTSEDMRTMRQLYSDGLFFQKFTSGLQSFYSKDWDHASQCFTAIVQRFEDGPSRYFLNQIEKHNGKPPRDFLGYGTA